MVRVVAYNSGGSKPPERIRAATGVGKDIKKWERCYNDPRLYNCRGLGKLILSGNEKHPKYNPRLKAESAGGKPTLNEVQNPPLMQTAVELNLR